MNMLKEHFVLWINATFRESGITLQKDGATFHTANLVQEWCNKIWQVLKELWPSSLPDLNQMDFAI